MEDLDKEKIMDALQRSFVLDEKSGRLTQRLTCRICNKSFPRLCNAASHVRIHFNARPYKCERCGLGFTQKGNWATHVRKGTCQRRLTMNREEKKNEKNEKKLVKLLHAK